MQGSKADKAGDDDAGSLLWEGWGAKGDQAGAVNMALDDRAMMKKIAKKVVSARVVTWKSNKCTS